MIDVILLLAVMGICVFAFACLALSQTRHWRSATGRIMPSRMFLFCLRGAGALLLAGGWSIALLHDGAGFGSLVWVCAISIAALIVTFALAWGRSQSVR